MIIGFVLVCLFVSFPSWHSSMTVGADINKEAEEVNNFPALVNIAKSISWEGEQMMYLERRGSSFGGVKESRRNK